MTQEEYNIISPAKFVEVLKRRVKKDWDAVVAVTGEEGSSKSTLASWLVYEGCIYDGLTHEEALKTFVEYTIFSPNVKRVEEQITKSKRYSIINADEAIKILYKQNWATPIQKFLNMFYALCRQENKISLLCMPRFLDFNEFFRNHRIKFWVHVLDRGVAVILERDWWPASADPWFLRESQKLNSSLYNKKKTADFNIEQKIYAISRLKNFVGVIKFDDLPNDIKKVYKAGKSEFAYKDLEEQIKQGPVAPGAREEKYREKLAHVSKVLREKGYTLDQIAEMVSTTPNTIAHYLKKNYDGEDIDENPSSLILNNNYQKEVNSD